jgi:hypothetical protein
MPVLPHLSLLLLLAARTPATPPTRAPIVLKTTAACSAATREDVEEALGRSLANGREHTDAIGSTCEYVAAGGEVTITIHRSTAKLNPAVEIENLKISVPGAGLRDVAGLGTRAVLLDMGGVGAQLHVMRGDYDYVLISVLGFGDAQRVSPVAEKIARVTLERF